MKVLVIASPLGRAGGIQRYTLTLVRALKELLGSECVQCLSIVEASDHRGNSRIPLSSKLGILARAFWKAATWRPDLIICNHVAVGPVGWLLARLWHRPYWVFVYGIEAWCELPKWKGRSLRQADRVIVISGFSRDQVAMRHDIGGDRISSLPCTLDETLLQIEPGEGGLCARIPEGQRIILTVARMASAERYKGHDEVLRALPAVVARVPNLTYAIVGDGDDRARLEQLAQTLGLGKHVLFTGEIADAELASLYRRSEVFLLPARTVIDKHHPKGEGFGIVYLEAMAFEKPVIGPNHGAPVEVVQHGKTGLLVNPDDSAATAEAILLLLTRPEWAAEMGKAGAERVRENYSYSRFRERLSEILAISPDRRLET